MYLFVFELLGTIAFAVSGATTGIRANMDVFGIACMALVTSTAGGVIRDVILGITPPSAFSTPSLLLVGMVTGIVVFLIAYSHKKLKKPVAYDFVILCMDSAGLGLFTVLGAEAAYESGDPGLALVFFCGVITGTGGGILRDVLSGQTPFVFRRHFYACACLAGVLLYVLARDVLGRDTALLIASIAVFAIRLLAARYHWYLPNVNNDNHTALSKG